MPRIEKDFENLSFEACTIFDAIISSKNKSNVMDFLRQTNNIQVAMIMDLISRTDKLKTDATLDDYVKYAAAITHIEGIRQRKRPFNTKSAEAEAIVRAVAEMISGLDQKTIKEITEEENITSAPDAEFIVFAGAITEYMRESIGADVGLKIALNSLKSGLNIESVNKIMHKFDDLSTLYTYYLNELKKNQTNPELWAYKAALEFETHENELSLFSMLEAARLSSRYADNLVSLVKTLKSDSKLMDRFYTSALNKIQDSEVFLKLCSAINDKTAIQLLKEVIKSNPNASYHLRLGELYINESNNSEGIAALVNAVQIDQSLFDKAFGQVINIGCAPKLFQGMSRRNLDIGKILENTKDSIREKAIKDCINEGSVFRYFISAVPKIKNLETLLLNLHKDSDVFSKISAAHAEEIGDTLAELKNNANATIWYDKTLSSIAQENISLFQFMKQRLHWKKYQINSGTQVGFESLIEVMKLTHLKGGYDALKIREYAKKEVLESKRLDWADTLLKVLGNDKSVISNDIQICDELGEKLQSKIKTECYKRLSELADDAVLKNLNWQEEKFLQVGGMFDSNDIQTKLKFLNAALQKYPRSPSIAIAKGNLLFGQGKQPDALETLLMSIKNSKEAKDGTLEVNAERYRTTVNNWIKNNLVEAEVKKYVVFSRDNALHNAEQWAGLGSLLEKRTDLPFLAVDCFNLAFMTGKNNKYLLHSAEIMDSYDKHKSLDIFAALGLTDVGTEALNAISQRISSGIYYAAHFSQILKYANSKTAAGKFSAEQIISLIEAAKKVGKKEYREFISDAYETICPVLNRGELYADKSRIELSLDKVKSLESAIKAAELNYSFFDNILSGNYEMTLLQSKFDKLSGMIKNKQHAVKLAGMFIGAGAPEQTGLGITLLRKAYDYEASPDLANNIGTLYEGLGNYPEALKFYKNAALLEGKFENLERFSEKRLYAKDYALAISGYDFILSKSQNDPAANLGSGICKLMLGMTGAAIPHFEKIMGKPTVWRDGGLFWKSIALERLGKPEDALAAVNLIGVAKLVNAETGEIVPHYANYIISSAKTTPSNIFSQKLKLELLLDRTEEAGKTIDIAPADVKKQFNIPVAQALAREAYRFFQTKDALEKANTLAKDSLKNNHNWLAYWVMGVCEESADNYMLSIACYQNAMTCLNVPNDLLRTSYKRCALKFREFDYEGYKSAVRSNMVRDGILNDAYPGWFGRFNTSKLARC